MVALHAEVMIRTRDSPKPLVDQGKLESAIMRPQFARQYAGADLVRQAALLGIGISQSQAFENGNKRTAFMALRTFLYLNGQRFVGDPLELAKELVAIAEREGIIEEATDHFTAWLRSHVAVREYRSRPTLRSEPHG